ncbi:MAG: hypothetical protein U0235_16785 [Polyangiaceae bacterium]
MKNEALHARFAAENPAFPRWESTRIKTRFYAPNDWATSDLAVRAAKQAMEKRVATEDIDLIIVGTDSPDYITPATSVVVQNKLGAKEGGHLRRRLRVRVVPHRPFGSKRHHGNQQWMKNVLVISAYMMHKLADPTDTAIFFYGDGAGARCHCSALQQAELMSASFRADGSFTSRCGASWPGAPSRPAGIDAINASRTRAHDREVPAEC